MPERRTKMEIKLVTAPVIEYSILDKIALEVKEELCQKCIKHYEEIE
jgi:hypothetical protein